MRAPAPTPTGSLDRLNGAAQRVLGAIAGVALVGMMLLTVVDMVMRALGWQLAGSYEMIGWLTAASMALALGYTQAHKGHVTIDLLTGRLGSRGRAFMDVLTMLLSLLLFCAAAWFIARYALVLQATGSLSETLRVVVFPWVYVVAAGAAGLALALLVDLRRAVARLRAARPAARLGPAPEEN